MNRIFFGHLLILICTATLFVGCDAAYYIKGTVYDGRHDYSRKEHLSDVHIRLLYQDASGRELLYGENETKTDNLGKYEFFFLGPPAGLEGNELLEFKKEGFETRRISVKDTKDQGNFIRVQRCQKTELYNYCWDIDVILGTP